MSRFQLVFLVFVSSVALSACEENKFMTPGDDVDQGTDNVAADASTTSPDAGQGVDTYVAADVIQSADSTANIDSNQGAYLATQIDSNLQTDAAQQADSGPSPDVAQQADTVQGTDAASAGKDAESIDTGIKPDVDANTADVQVNNDVETDANVLCQIVSNCGGWKNGCCICKGAWLYPDLDHDSYGQAQINATWGCADQTNKDFVLVSGDCNDNMTAVHPGAMEVCFNNIDDNCNGQTDEGCATVTNCVPTGKDFCDGIDNDCDGVTDNGVFWMIGDAGGPAKAVYVDDDGDSYGSPNKMTFLCITFYDFLKKNGDAYDTDVGGDCNDQDPSVHPNATEVCGNNFDDNCNGQTDEGCGTCKDGTTVPYSALVKWYQDLDKDTYAGTTTDGQLHCPQDWKPDTGWYTESLDCDDANPMIHPGAFTFTHPNGTYEEEFCNGKDDNCDGQTDEGFNIGQACVGSNGVCQVAGKIECGGMGFGVGVGVPDPTSVISICSVNPFQSLSQAVTEVCGDNLDNDCDGVTDNGCVKNNSVECKLLGGTNGSDGYCKTFCDSCKAFQTCLDVNKDGIADTCEDPPTNGGYFPEEGLIALRFKNLGYVPSNIVGTVHYYKSLSDYTNLSGWDPVDFGAFFDALNFYALTELGQKFNDPNKAPDVCGMQFNATIFKNGVATDWLCEGSGTLSHVIDGAQILYLHHDVLIDITKRVTVWKDPNQNGCNVTIPDSETCPLQTPKP